MMYRSKHSRRRSKSRFFVLNQAAELLEQRMLLSSAVTITNDPGSAPVDGSLTVSVDPFGSFGESFPQSGALYDPFPFGNGNAYNSVRVSSLYFQPAGGFLTSGYVLPDQTAAQSATNVQFTSTSVNTAVSTFSIAGFDVTLTQTVAAIPASDSVTYLTQTYQITDVSNSEYLNTPFNVVHLLFADRTDAIISNWGALSGDNRIGIAFTSKDTNAIFQRIDALGVNSGGGTVYDWDTTNSPVGFDITNEAATSSENPNYYQNIVANSGIPAADNGNVDGENNGDLIDDTSPPDGQGVAAVVAVQDSLEFTSLGQTITYITRTGWGDTGAETPTVYHQPGTFDIAAVTPNAPEGTSAVLQITRTDGSLGHASVTMNDTNWTGTATPGAPTNPNADFQAIVNNVNQAGNGILPPVNVILADGETATGSASYTDNPAIPVFDDVKIEPSEFFAVQIDNPQDNAKLAKGDTATSPPTLTDVGIPANDQPSPFHFSDTDPANGDSTATTFNEDQASTQIPVVRNVDDGATPTNTGPYGNFNVQYTITGTGANPATPGVDFVDNTPGAVLDTSTNTYTGSLNFTAATSAAQAATMVLGMDYQYINLQMLNDNLYEGPETFTITLESSNSLLITSPSTFVGTIDDAQTSGPVHLQYASESVAEDAGSKTIGVIRSLASTGDNGQVTMDYTVQGGSAADQAVAGVDFTVPGATLNGDSYTGTLTFLEGSSTPQTPLIIDLISTNLAEPSKTLTISLSDPNHISGLLGEPNIETLTITNNNTPGEVYFLGGPAQTITEGPDSATGAPYKTLTLQVTRDPADGSEGAVSVQYNTVDGTAIAGTNYDSASGTLTWADGETGPKSITIKVLDDSTDTYPRTNKTFSVTLTSPTGGVALATPSSVAITILDNKQPGVNLSDTTYTAYEKDPSTGQVGTANIIVERDLATGQAAGAWSFTYAVIPGTAVANVDYTPPATTTVDVPASDASYTIQIPLLSDPNSIADTNFTVRLTSGAIGGAVALGSSTGATVTILNADASVQLSAPTYTANPGSSTVPIVITRTSTEQSDVPITVSYTTADGTALAGKDYTATTGTITIPADQTSVTVNVPILTPLNSSLPTKSFSFKITNAVLANSSDANSVNLHFNSTPSTVNIAGLVNVTSIQLLPGRANRIAEVVVTFSDPLVAAGANNINNYILASAGRKGVFNSHVALTNAQYDPTNQSVALFVKTPLRTNKLYQLSIRPTGIQSTAGQPFITGAPGGLGGTAIATFSRGSKVTYTDPDGDIVTLIMKHGGSMDFIDGLNGGNPNLTLTGSAKSQLTGALKPKGDGHAIIDSINNLDGVQDTLLTNTLFSVENV